MRKEEVLRRVSEERSLLVTGWKRKANLIGHIMRSDGLLRVVLEGRLMGKRSRGRRRMMMLDDIVEERECHQTTERDRWQRLTCAGPVRRQIS